MKAKLVKIENTFYLKQGGTTLATSSSPNLSASIRYSLSLENCEVIERGYDLDELAKDRFGNSSHHTNNRCSYKEGFQKALEILGDKKFSEEKMKLFAEYVWKEVRSGRMKSMDELFNDWTSPQQTEWEVEIEMEYINIGAVSSYCHPKDFETEIPKLDADGCLILKRVI